MNVDTSQTRVPGAKHIAWRFPFFAVEVVLLYLFTVRFS